ncbi:TonB-dependent receptor [Tamlana fucoidanivorans]|uniref:TonB-dependent receptor n=1 Tax=Allotamlana fucoidanivorans TaxID=2583814 RepID=A0A5C4SQ63_9FLAO|nr:TonB-dependent receptor [Tamlana fucoidanivorans]TNJ46066.1 TonB-dependent receptor [Tamlana fucoidanivorans]
MTKREVKILLLMMFCVYSSNYLGGQEKDITITGKIIDVNGQPLIGATVLEKGTNNATVANFDGFYELKLRQNTARGAVLQFSYIGMDVIDIPYSGNSVINVTLLQSDDNILDEVVVIGYATEKRKDVTGAISSVKGEDLEDVPVPNALDALKGRIPGLSIISSSAAQDSEISVRVRGGISITQNNSPLYIVDGFPMIDGFEGLNPNDIESIDVLKDAAATAIYGSNGANGVIIITTKSGFEGKSTINYQTFVGVKTPSRRIDVLNPLEYVLYDYERTGGGVGWEEIYGPIEDVEKNYANRKGVNWQDEVYGGKAAINQMQRISLSGGSSSNTYNMTYTFNDDDNIVPNSGYSTQALRASFGQKMGEKLKVNLNINYFTDNLRGVGPYGESGRQMIKLINYRPTAGINFSDEDLINNDIDPLFDDEDDTVIDVNPLTNLQTQLRDREKIRATYSFGLNYDINDSFKYSFSIGMTNNEVMTSRFFTARSSSARLSGGPSGQLDQQKQYQYFGNHTLAYKPILKGKKYKFDVLVGQEIREFKSESLGVSASGFPDENFGINAMQLGTIPGIPYTNKASEKLLSFFGRANYKLFNKYILTATLRADGSTKFGQNNKWGYFPAVALSWQAHKEKVIENLNVFSNLKFRVSYGETGNSRIPNFQSLSLYESDFTPYNNRPGVSYLPTLPNSNLKWETNISKNLGMEMGFFKNRLVIIADLYENESRDLLLSTRLVNNSGFSTAIRNIGSTQNRGLEIGVQSRNIRNENFSWTTNFNIAFNENKVLKLADKERWEIQSRTVNNSGSDFVIEEGKTTGLMYGLVYDGLYTTDDFDWDADNSAWVLKDGIPVSSFQTPEPGVTKYVDVSGPDGIPDGILDAKDKDFIGDANPDFTGGILNTFRYKNIDLSMFWNFKYGGNILNGNVYQLLRGGSNKSTAKFIYDKQYKTYDSQGNDLLATGNVEALKAINENAELPSQRANFVRLDSYMIEDASYARLSQLTLGYSFSKNVLNDLGLSKFRLYASFNNLLTITDYSGFDPEVRMNANNGLTPGIDRGSFPRSVSYVFGLDVSL